MPTLSRSRRKDARRHTASSFGDTSVRFSRWSSGWCATGSSPRISRWLFKIANNVAIDHLRRRQLDTVSMEGSPHATTNDLAEATSFELAASNESPLQELEARELGSEIERAISQLRPEYRACILLRHVEDKSYEEIAATLDLPLGTVKTYIHRARHELRRLLEHVRDGGIGPLEEGEPA